MESFLGIDIGSKTSKGVLIAGDRTCRHILPSGINYKTTAEQLREKLVDEAGVRTKEITYTVATGHADSVTFCNEYVTDIRCCARGMHHELPEVRTIIDIQGQSSQVILVGDKGQVRNFVISEKCAGGSGRFLDVVANVLRIKVEDIGAISLKSQKPVVFTTGCAVFGESEAISRVAEGMTKEDILAGIHRAIAEKISALVSRLRMDEPCGVGGGGALNIGLVKSLEEKLETHLLVPPQPQFLTALGAAIIAREHNNKSKLE